MHELSICQSLVNTILEEMNKHGGEGVKLVRARVKMGKLHQIVPEMLEQAYHVLIKDTVADGSVLDVEHVPVVLKCGKCGWQGEMQEMFFRCGSCGSTEVDVVSGKEMSLETIEVEREE